MTQECIDQNRVMFSCKLVTLAEKYDKMLCMNLDVSSILNKIIFARNLLTTLCIIQDSTCYDITIAEAIVYEIDTVL
jgi:hypothetical protein